MRSEFDAIDVHTPARVHDWMRHAACLGKDPGLWFPEKPDNYTNNNYLTALTEQAKAICAGCPVREQCAELGKDEDHGIWGGSNRDRKARTNQYAERTHCLRGHEFTPENTRKRDDGTRGCRACENQKRRERYARSKEQAA